jgi:LuxR family maltose regulon positive regulatory protein
MNEPKQAEQARHWILRSKLEMPRKNARLIFRAKLLERLDGWLDLGLGVVIAPAGYAKSTTVAEWCRKQIEDGTTVAWLSLDEGDREPAQFLSYVIATFANVGVATRGLEVGAEEGFFAGGLSTALSALLESVAALQRPVVLVLDDYHRVNAPKVDALLREMLNTAPGNLTVIASTRTPLPFDIGALLASGRAEELTAEFLRFSREELASVFQPTTDSEALSLLYDRTEGWPVAVQLARLVVTDAPTKGHFDKFHGHSGHIATYLAEQIVSGLPDDLQEFLCYTSVVERFTAELADAIRGKGGSETHLGNLEPLNALVIRAEGNDSSYRYHHLFAEFLQKELRRRFGDDGVVQVHHRASQWFEDNGYMAEAVRHSREARDYDRCASLVEKAGGWELILFGGIGYLRGLLQHIPDDVATQYPRILLAKAYLGVKDGLLAESRALLDAAANARHKSDLTRLQRDILNVGTLIFVYEDTPVSTQDILRLQQRLTGVPADDPLTRSILACQLIVCELAVGQFANADHLAQATMRTMREARTVLGLNYCYLHAGLAALYQGRLKAAEAHFGVARRMAEENFAHDPGLRALSRLLTGALQHWMGQHANYTAEQSRADLEQVEHYDGWFDIFAAGVVVEAYHLDSPDDAVSRAQRIADRRGLKRLAQIADSIQVGLTQGADRSTKAMKLVQQLPSGIWQAEPFWWLPFLESRAALASYYASIDRSRAINALNEAIICAQTFGANLHLVRLLIARALLHDLSGQRGKAIDDLTEALSVAAPEGMVGPFLGQKGIVPLLRAVTRHAQDAFIDILVIEFAGSLVDRITRQGSEADDSNSGGLSVREREVLDELANGRSNKEIARLLDMTEHTVKFHLKNIFVKLGAERRTEAVARAKHLKLI